MGAIDTSTELGARVDRRLRTERTIWLATVDRAGAPRVRPVWFLWDGASFLLYSQPSAAKVEHIEANPHVCLHLDADEWGESVVIVDGRARLAPDHRRADEMPAFVEKYAWGFERFGFSAPAYGRDYSMPILVTCESLNAYY
ncbi:MAG TPA: TIGR03667 family PPOX class F420-dependent oxidoreductase [Gaiellaceae bacterium]|nr:TIGR03667 family PPOX class F420-dependent oxidoreductase [Gaiellaceae bacterium]